MHCDYLFKSFETGKAHNRCDEAFEFQYNFDIFKKHCQAFAIFIPDQLPKKMTAQALFKKELQIYNQFMSSSETAVKADFRNILPGKVNGFLTLENATLLQSIDDIEILKRIGVKSITLTWNGENKLGYGHLINSNLKPFGRECVKKIQKECIIVDVSHLSEKGFFDVMDISQKPIIASHSNCKKLCPNSRNLTDEQIKSIIQNHGIIGICFHKIFLSENENSDFVETAIKHIEHILSLGGYETVAIGSDFDGGNLPNELINTLSIEKIINKMLKLNYNDDLVCDILYNNAAKFFEKHTQGII